MAAAGGPRGALNVLLQELQAVLPKALDVCSGASGAAASGASSQATCGAAAGGEDLVLSRLRSVLFALLHSCLGVQPGK